MKKMIAVLAGILLIFLLIGCSAAPGEVKEYDAAFLPQCDYVDTFVSIPTQGHGTSSVVEKYLILEIGIILPEDLSYNQKISMTIQVEYIVLNSTGNIIFDGSSTLKGNASLAKTARLFETCTNNYVGFEVARINLYDYSSATMMQATTVKTNIPVEKTSSSNDGNHFLLKWFVTPFALLLICAIVPVVIVKACTKNKKRKPAANPPAGPITGQAQGPMAGYNSQPIAYGQSFSEKEVIREKQIIVYIRCPYCKAKYPESASSCPNCGSKD